MTAWRMCTACQTPKTTNTHSEYVILIAFQQQQWLQKRASLLTALLLLKDAASCQEDIAVEVRMIMDQC